MTEKKNWGSTVLGWFIVSDDEASPSSATANPASDSASEAAVIAAAAASDPAGATDPGSFFKQEPPAPTTEGQVPFDEVFDAAGIDADERDRMGKAQQLLGSLPAETPLPVKKQIVEASLKAFGVPIENIIEAGVAEIQALEGYIRKSASDSQAAVDESASRIAQFQAEIEKLRGRMEQQQRQQQAVAAACNAKKLDVQKVLEFFGQEAVARVVQASPRLHDPSASSG